MFENARKRLSQHDCKKTFLQYLNNITSDIAGKSYKLLLMIFTYRLLTKQRHILWIFSHKTRAGNQIFCPFGNIH